jgi:hypothetical protein
MSVYGLITLLPELKAMPGMLCKTAYSAAAYVPDAR